MPNFSPLANAYSRQSSRTTHPRHTSFASRVDAPRSGKNRSGSTPMQFALVCQLRSWGPYINDTMSIDRSPSQSSTRFRAKPHSTDVVTDMSSFTIRTGNARKSCSGRGAGGRRAGRSRSAATRSQPRSTSSAHARWCHGDCPVPSKYPPPTGLTAVEVPRRDPRRPGSAPPPDGVSRPGDPGSGGWSCGPGNRPARNRPIRRVRWQRCVPG
jgi:hypothetical protein